MEIEVLQDERSLRLQVAGDSGGLPRMFATGAERLKRQQFGIVNMEEWSIGVDGQLTLGARRGGGTVVSLSIPLPSWQDAAA